MRGSKGALTFLNGLRKRICGAIVYERGRFRRLSRDLCVVPNFLTSRRDMPLACDARENTLTKRASRKGSPNCTTVPGNLIYSAACAVYYDLVLYRIVVIFFE